LFGDPAPCFCVLPQAEAPLDLEACTTYLDDPVVNDLAQPVDAWCFIDAMADPRVGAPELTVGCPADRRRLIRLAGASQQVDDSNLYLYCN
jgi:hypothetical protein